MNAVALANYEPLTVKNSAGQPVVQAITVTDEQVNESIKAIGGNLKHRRSSRVSRLVAEALKNGNQCPD